DSGHFEAVRASLGDLTVTDLPSASREHLDPLCRPSKASFRAPSLSRQAQRCLLDRPREGSSWIESNTWCPRLTAAMILSGSAVQLKGLGLSFTSAMKGVD